MFAGDARHPVVAKLSDFGGALPDIPNLTSLQFGTPPWNAPGGNCERPREELLNSDVYSLGMVIWHVMLNGRSPFHDTELFQLPDLSFPEIIAEKHQKYLIASPCRCPQLLRCWHLPSIRTASHSAFQTPLRCAMLLYSGDIKTIAKLLNCSER